MRASFVGILERHDGLHPEQKTYGVAGRHPLEDFARFVKDSLSLGGAVGVGWRARGLRRRPTTGARRLLARARPLLASIYLLHHLYLDLLGESGSL